MRTLMMLSAAALLSACATTGSQAPAPKAASNQTFITEQRWAAEQITGRKVMDGRPVTLTIDSDGKLRGSAGCNSYVAQAYLEPGDKIGVGALGISKQGCTGARLNQQMRFVRAMMLATHYEVKGNELYIYSEGEGKPTTFKAQ